MNLLRFLWPFSRGGHQVEALDAVSFDDHGFTAIGIREGVRVWYTAEGDGIGLYHFALPPDLPHASSFTEFDASYRAAATASGVSVVDLEIRTSSTPKLVYAIVKISQGLSGMTYLGSITLPYMAFSYVIKIQCEEGSITGIREATLLAEALERGTVASQDGAIVGEWNPDDSRFDERFPDHPLSRLRRTLALIESTLRVDDRVARAPSFPLPG